MPRKSKVTVEEIERPEDDEVVEEISDELEPVVNPEEEVELVLEPEPAPKAKKDLRKQEEEIEYLAPYGAPRPLFTGNFLYTISNIYTVAEADGKKYSFPYNHLLHKDLKANDEIKF